MPATVKAAKLSPRAVPSFCAQSVKSAHNSGNRLLPSYGETTTSKNLKAEDRASRILAQLDEAVCVKLKELKADIEKLRNDFKDLKGKETIAGCKTWTQFCERKLHRTDRCVRKMLAGPKPEQSKEQRGPAELCSAGPEAPSGDQRSNEKKPLDAEEESTLAKDKAIVAAIHYLSRFNGLTLQRKLQEFCREVMDSMDTPVAAAGFLQTAAPEELAPAEAKKPAATATLESAPESAEVTV